MLQESRRSPHHVGVFGLFPTSCCEYALLKLVLWCGGRSGGTGGNGGSGGEAATVRRRVVVMVVMVVVIMMVVVY
jgi:hypothetical protein